MNTIRNILDKAITIACHAFELAMNVWLFASCQK